MHGFPEAGSMPTRARSGVSAAAAVPYDVTSPMVITLGCMCSAKTFACTTQREFHRRHLSQLASHWAHVWVARAQLGHVALEDRGGSTPCTRCILTLAPWCLLRPACTSPCSRPHTSTSPPASTRASLFTSPSTCHVGHAKAAFKPKLSALGRAGREGRRARSRPRRARCTARRAEVP
jgi:hypothetical protein